MERRQRTLLKDTHDKRALDAFSFCRRKDLPWVRAAGNQSIAFHRHPSVRMRGAILVDPVHFTCATAGWLPGRRGLMLQSIREAEHLRLPRRWKAVDLLKDGFLILPELTRTMLEAPGTNRDVSDWRPLQRFPQLSDMSPHSSLT